MTSTNHGSPLPPSPTPRSMLPLCGECREPLRLLMMNGAVVGNERCGVHPHAQTVFEVPLKGEGERALTTLVEAIGFTQVHVATTCDVGHDLTPPNELLAAISGVRAHLAARKVWTEDDLREPLAWALNQAWSDFTSDTGCYPDCIQVHTRRGKRPEVSANFEVSNFASSAAGWLAFKLGDSPAVPSRGQPQPTIDSVLFKLEEVMHACCDQPLGVDSMTLTRSWRGILEDFAATGEHEWPCEHAAGGAGACADSDCPAFVAADLRETAAEAPAVDWQYAAEQTAGRLAELERAWMGLVREVAKLATACGDPDEWHEADDSTLNAEFDPSHVVRQACASVASLSSERDAARAERDSLRNQLEMAQFVQRFGTPFDPTGAKTGIEIQSLRAECEAWRLAAAKLSLTIADVSTPSAFLSSQALAANALINDRAALRAERDSLVARGLSDAEKLKAHLRGCAECSAGDYCDEGESFGGDVTRAYLYRITVSNGCRADAASKRVAAYRALRSSSTKDDQ